MKADNAGGIRLNVSLRPINKNLTDSQVLELYHSGRMIYVETEEGEEIIKLMNKAISRTMKCRHIIAKGKTINDIYTHFKKVFGSDDRQVAVEKMRNASKRKQFICEQVGVLIEMGVIYADTHEAAKALGYTSITTETAMRYIRRGKQILKDLSANIR